jgi:tRNA (guanine37-N1)-methyltransferase
MINFKIFTLFPELFPGPLSSSITGIAFEKKIWSHQVINIRDYATDKRKTVDDTPYGGGAGMLLKAEVIAEALEKNLINPKQEKIIYLSPKGKLFNQKIARNLAKEKEISFICGRYEGIDQRIIDEFEIEEISIGDYILSGGELACYVVIDAILRNISGVLGKEASLDQESFGSKEGCEFENLLEYPHFTKPAIWRGRKVPEVLISGNHQEIKKWKKKFAIELTKKVRPDLLKENLSN